MRCLDSRLKLQCLCLPCSLLQTLGTTGDKIPLAGACRQWECRWKPLCLQDSWLYIFALAGVEFYSTEHSSGQTPVCASMVLPCSTEAKETFVQRPCFVGSERVPEQTWSLPHPDTLWSISAVHRCFPAWWCVLLGKKGKGKGCLGRVEWHKACAVPGCLSGMNLLSLSPVGGWITDVKLLLSGGSMCSGVP